MSRISPAQGVSEAGNIWAQKEDFSLPGRSRLMSKHLALLGLTLPLVPVLVHSEGSMEGKSGKDSDC